MISLHGVLAVARFETHRSLTPTRIGVWVALASFPAALVALMRWTGFEAPDPRLWTIFLTFLCCGVVCLLSLLLWAAPMIQAELEANTWVYAATRPAGRISLLWGRYLVAVGWSLAAAWTALLLAFPLAQPPEFFHTLGVLMALAALAAVSYGAAYALIGVISHRRAMPLCVAYTLIFEVLVSLIPAVVNQLTLQYRLRCLMVVWLEWREEMPEEMERFLFSPLPSWMHVLALLAATGLLMGAATYWTLNSELVTSDE